MNIGISSFTVAITRCNIPYTDDIYRVTLNSYSNNTHPIARRYIPGGYSPFSNQFSFNYFPPALSNNATYVNLTNLTPDTSYYYTTELKNKVSRNYVRIYNGLLASNFIRTNIPTPPTYIDRTVFVPINPITTYTAIPCISNIYGDSAIVDNIIATSNLIFKNLNLIGIHNTSNIGSTSNSLCTINVNIFENQTLINTQNIELDSFTGIAKSTSNNRPIVLSVSNYKDYYFSLSNFTGFYNTVASNNFTLKFNYYGEGGISNITSPYLKTIYITQILENGETYSNSIQQYYTDGLNSAISFGPRYNINLSNLTTFSTINQSNVIYINGMLSFTHTLTYNNVIIEDLYKSFLATGNIIYTDFYLTQDFPYNNYEILSLNAMTASNLRIYTLQNEEINITQRLVAPDSVVINNFVLNLDKHIFSQTFIQNPLISFNAKNYLGDLNSNIFIENIYWDLPSVEVLNNTSEPNIILSKGYGIRVTSGNMNSNFKGTAKSEQIMVFFGNPFNTFSIPFNNKLLSNFGEFFDHTINLMSNTLYKYELPLFGGYYQTVNFSNWYNVTFNTNINFGYKNNSTFDNNYSSQYSSYIYPDYTNLHIDTESSTYFRYASFKYTIPPKTIVNNGICMIQFINNNFLMDSETSSIRDYSTNIPLGNNFNNYFSYLIQYKIATTDSNYETAWFSLQHFAIPNIDFQINRYFSEGPGALTNIPFIDNSGTNYVNSSSNRIFLIPQHIENIGFDLFIRVGIPKNDVGGFQYISTCFNLVNN
jgi:hypothetical protein